MSERAHNDLPSLSIRRPVLVLVANLLIVLAGLAALAAVEVRELPDVDRPVVSVRVDFPGASPQTMDSEVISLLEGAVARVSGIYRIRSASEENNGRINIEFNLDQKVDQPFDIVDALVVGAENDRSLNADAVLLEPLDPVADGLPLIYATFQLRMRLMRPPFTRSRRTRNS